MALEKLGELLTALLIASLTWASGLLAPNSGEGVAAPVAPVGGPGVMLGWAQSEPAQIEQVGEGNAEDPENLDQGVAPAQGQVVSDTETLDQATPGEVSGNDVETLDQGAPPAAAPATQTAAPVSSTAPATAAPVYSTEAPAAPATSYAAPAPPAASAGPALPPGFGTGRVHVATGQGGFPPGLESCHVGAVTGRAYVGIDCGDDGAGDSFVGHAASFDDFPFVVPEDFPFDDRGGLFSSGNENASSGNGSGAVLAPGGKENKKVSKEDQTVGSGSSIGTGAVEMAQGTVNRKPRVRVSAQRNSQHGAKSKKSDNAVAHQTRGDNQNAKGGQQNRNGSTVSSDSKKQKAHKKHGKKHDRKQKRHGKRSSGEGRNGPNG